MTINMKKCVIELSKKEAKAAAKFGTPEYKNLQEARKDYPSFSVVTASQKAATKKNTFKGLNYEYMEMYIQKHDDDDKTIMAEYLMLRGLSDEAKENLIDAHSYIEMKKWFLNKFPAIRDYHENCSKLIAA